MSDSKETEGEKRRRNLLKLLGLSAAVSYSAPVLSRLSPAAAETQARRISHTARPARMTRPARVTGPSL